MKILLAVAVLASFPTILRATPCAPPSPKPVETVIAVEHDGFDKKIRIGKPDSTWSAVPPVALDPPPRVPTGTVGILVLKTNTALYTYEASGTAKPSEEIVALQGFVKGLKPYLVAVVQATLKKMAGPAPPLAGDERALVAKDLGDLETALWGANGLEAARATSIAMLNESQTPFVPLPKSVAAYFTGSPLPKETCTPCGVKAFKSTASLTAAEELRRIHPELQAHLASLLTLRSIRRAAAAQSTAPVSQKTADDDKEIDDLVEAATDALGNFPEYFAAAAAVEKAGRRLMAATDAKCLTDGIEAVKLSKSVDLAATVAPLDAGIGATNTPLPAVTVKTTARPDWALRPALGLSLLRAGGAKYPTFKAKEVGDGFEVAEAGVQDSRVDWALMLSFAPRGLDGRDSKGFTLWLPTLLVNPSDSVRAVGFGAGLSYKVLKLDAGFIWTKHSVLDGQTVGQPLAAAEDLRTVNSYGEGKFYVGFSIVGWSPFKSE